MNHDKLIALRAQGLCSEGIGPEQEWHPVPAHNHQQRHTMFWGVVTGILSSEPGEYADLPEWMTEAATSSLNLNGI